MKSKTRNYSDPLKALERYLMLEVSQTECDYCGEWYVSCRPACTHCGAANADLEEEELEYLLI